MLCTSFQVEWEPYGGIKMFGIAHEFPVNPMCVAEGHLWTMRRPLICMWVVGFHLPHRVLRQFGQFQPHPPEWVNTDIVLHG